MTTLVAIAVFALYFFALFKFAAWAQRKVPAWLYALCWFVWCAVWFVVDVFQHDQVGMALQALVGSYWLREFWRRKPPFDRKKVEQLVGAKTKALKQKVVDSMPKASPVGQPALVPAGV